MPDRRNDQPLPPTDARDAPCPQEVLEAALTNGWVPHDLPSREKETPE